MAAFVFYLDFKKKILSKSNPWLFASCWGCDYCSRKVVYLLNDILVVVLLYTFMNQDY